AEEEGEPLGEGEIEIREGETLAEIKERIRKEQQKAKKPAIPPELLNTANSYEDKVGVVRMVVQADQTRVASVIRSMIQVGK
ncbi:MAG: Flagellar M-ring protein, partial [Pseudomonadota bacterium]